MKAIVIFAATLGLVSSAEAQTAYQWSNFAGVRGGSGNVNGVGEDARVNPFGIALDGSGNAYVADGDNRCIRKVTPAGVVTILAGNPFEGGSTDGTLSVARFNGPIGIAIDGGGNLYVTDNHTIRKITSAGMVSTLAGTPFLTGSADANGANARFNEPGGLAIDSAGNLYVADRVNHTIRKVTPGGDVSTYAGSAGNPGSANGDAVGTARFRYPEAVVVDGTGNLYVADSGNYTIRKVATDGTVSTLAGLAGSFGGTDGTGSAARFFEPQALTLDADGNLYVGDTLAVRRITPGGVVTTLAGGVGIDDQADGTGAAAQFVYANAITYDGVSTLYVCDSSTIRKVTLGGVATTWVGSAERRGSADTVGSDARFHSPADVAVDGSGNLYVADTGNHAIRKISPAGTVTTLAGRAGATGTADGTADTARFNNPTGVAVDGSGFVYVADKNSHTIRKITPAGVVSTLAGSPGAFGSADGTATARFKNPTGVAVDGGGNVYVADTGNHTIRMITSAGLVSTLTGSAGSSGSTDGTLAVARFTSPQGVAVGSAGTLYVADTFNAKVRKITSAGIVSTLAAVAAPPWRVAADGAGNIYTAIFQSNTIIKITSAGAVSTLAGTALFSGSLDATGDIARFAGPTGVAVDAAGNILVADSGNHVIRKVTSAGVVSTVAGRAGYFGTGDGITRGPMFDNPTGVAADTSGNVYVADLINARIRKITPGGIVTTLAGKGITFNGSNGTGSEAGFYGPEGIAVDSGGTVYVADSSAHTIRKITAAGVATTLAGTGGQSGSTDDTGAAARFNHPTGVAVDATGNVYVADYNNHTIRKITSGGLVSTLAGGAGVAGYVDDMGTAARFNYPYGVAVDIGGNVYVSDSYNQRVRKISPAGLVSTLAGGAYPWDLDGTGTAAGLGAVEGIAIDGAGDLYVADRYLHIIRKITSLGVVTTIGGTSYVTGGADGIGPAAAFALPQGIACTSTGILYVADSSNNSIFKGIGVAAFSEIDVQLPPGNSLTDGAGTVLMGTVSIGSNSAAQTFTVFNTGTANLTGIAVSKGTAGNPADFVVNTSGMVVSLAPGASTTFSVTFSPSISGARTAGLLIASNDGDENPFDITLSATGTGFTGQETWRQQYFGITSNSGNAADNFDFDKDGLVNLLEFAFGLNPTQNSAGQLPQGQKIGSNFVISFTQPSGASSITYGAEWSTTLTGTWNPITDTGVLPQHTFSVPIGANTKLFVRMKVTAP